MNGVLRLLVVSILAIVWVGHPVRAGAISLDQDFLPPGFTQPYPAARVLLLSDGKYLLFFNTSTLSDQRTGAITRYFSDGTLDPGFKFSRDYDDVSAVAVTANGQLIVAATQHIYEAAQTKILRVNADGSADATFTPVVVGPDVANVNVRALTIQPDGKILVAGLFDSFAGLDRQVIVRLLADGTLDSNFNAPQFDNDRTGIYTRPVLLPDGKILIGGNFTHLNGASSLSVARLNADGSRDTTFQAAGFTRVNGYSIRGIVVQNDGKIVLAARFQFGTGSSATRAPLLRLNSNGSYDSTFTSETSISSTPSARDLVAQPDGRLLAASGTSFYRFMANGALDNSFTPPTLVDDSYTNFELSGFPVTVQVLPDGRILLGGTFTDVNPTRHGVDAHFGVARVNADGTLDASFVTTHRTGTEVLPSDFARNPDNSTFAAFAIPPFRLEPVASFSLARLEQNGFLDASFHLTSAAATSLVDSPFLTVGFERLADGDYLVRGQIYTPDIDSYALGKFRPTGGEDTSFVISSSVRSFEKVTPLPDGRNLLVAGIDPQQTIDGIVTALQPDGELDPSFQVDPSIVSAQILRSADGYLDRLYAGSYILARQGDGKLVFLYLSRNDQLFHLVRLNSNGSIDDSFSGATLPADSLSISYPSVFDSAYNATLQPVDGVWSAKIPIREATIQPDGCIILAGRFTSFNGVAAGGVVRLFPNGSLDSSFAAGSGAQWTSTAETATYYPYVEDMAVQSGGKLLLVGTFEAFNGVALPGIASLNSDGSVDASFIPPIKRNPYSAASSKLARQPDGSFLLSGPYLTLDGGSATFVRLKDDGGIPVLGSPIFATTIAGQNFSYKIIASGQPTGFSASNLPAGLTLNPATGLITGSTSAIGTYVITLTATNAEGSSADYKITLVVTGPIPAITSPTSVTVYAGQQFTYQITASNQPTNFVVEGLPWDASFDSATGVISTYLSEGSTSFVVRARNNNGTGSAIVTFTVGIPPSPANDNFANATVISGTVGTVAGSTFGATTEAGEPNHSGQTGGSSVWYSWTAPVTGNFIFDTNGTSFNTLLAAYTGASVSNLSLVTFGYYKAGTLNQFQLTASKGVTYKIAVDGASGVSGSCILNWKPGAPLYGFSTYSGNIAAGSSDGSITTARFYNPYGCAADASGNVFVADTFNHTIRKITHSGAVSTVAGLAGQAGSSDGSGSAARFSYPIDIAVDTSGNLYVADWGNATIRKITSQGMVTTLAGSPGLTGSTNGQGSAARFSRMFGLAVDSTGNVYVADTDNNTIRKVTPTGLVSTVAGSAGVSGSNDGTFSSARFNAPRGVAVDASGNIFVADAANVIIRKLALTGTTTTVAGMAGDPGALDGIGSNARFWFPTHLALDGAGNLFVADASTIRQVSPDNNVAKLGGLLTTPGAIDGLGGNARFNPAFGIAVDSLGKLYVTDVSNNAIRLGRPLPSSPLQITSLTGTEVITGVMQPNAQVQILAANNMTDPFVLLTTVTADAFGIYEFDDPDAASLPRRFYRALMSNSAATSHTAGRK